MKTQKVEIFFPKSGFKGYGFIKEDELKKLRITGIKPLFNQNVVKNAKKLKMEKI